MMTLHTLRKVIGLTLLVAGGLITTGCLKPFNSRVLIQTKTVEQDVILGEVTFPDPYRGYYGAATTSVERNGARFVNGATNGNAQDQRHTLSVPNDWTFVNTDGPCFNMVTYNSRATPNGVINLKCKVYTGYNRSQYTPVGLDGESLDADGAPVPEPEDLGTSYLWPGQEMGPRQALRSGGGDYSLILLDDGNLIQVYNGNDTRWDTATNSGTHLLMQLDGNLVLYDSGWNPVWDSGTWGHPGAYLNVQDDGNLVVYSSSNAPLWSRW